MSSKKKIEQTEEFDGNDPFIDDITEADIDDNVFDDSNLDEINDLDSLDDIDYKQESLRLRVVVQYLF